MFYKNIFFIFIVFISSQVFAEDPPPQDPPATCLALNASEQHIIESPIVFNIPQNITFDSLVEGDSVNYDMALNYSYDPNCYGVVCVVDQLIEVSLNGDVFTMNANLDSSTNCHNLNISGQVPLLTWQDGYIGSINMSISYIQ